MREAWDNFLGVLTFGLWFVVILTVVAFMGTGLVNVLGWLFTGHMIFG